MTRWHRLHRHYARVLRTDEQRIRFSIAGAVNVAGVDYGDIGERCRPFLGWIGRDDVCAVRYEDLVGEGRGEQIARMIRFYAARTGLDDDLGSLRIRAEANIDPARSRTFRRGAAGGWADLFTDEHRDIFKQKAGGLLVELGYEQDENW